MKRILSIFTLSLALTLAPISKSMAGIGALAGAPALVTVGSVVLGGSLPLTFLLDEAGDGAGFIGIIAGFFGLIILEDGGETLRFSGIDQEMAKKIGVSKSEMDLYNDNVEELNVLISDYTFQVKEDKLDYKNSQILWSSLVGELPQEVNKTLKAIGKHLESAEK